MNHFSEVLFVAASFCLTFDGALQHTIVLLPPVD